VSFIAMRAGVPVVPVAFVGTDKVLPRGQRFVRAARVTIKFGTPIDPSTFIEGTRKERMEALTATIMERIAEELEAARRL
jgi:1-acyl-sn-glycerol-3-phosphate acyltransferase